MTTELANQQSIAERRAMEIRNMHEGSKEAEAEYSEL
jgi:hypothetical protein